MRIENQISICLSREADQGHVACSGVKLKWLRWVFVRKKAPRVTIDARMGKLTAERYGQLPRSTSRGAQQRNCI
jgi:hypothetical protein